VAAEIPAFPATWKITFDLKLTEKVSRCCAACGTGIFAVSAGNSFLKERLPMITYSCGKGDRKSTVEITHIFGTGFYRMKKTKELLVGEWFNFEISQAIGTWKKENGVVIFKAALDGEVIARFPQRKPFEGPVKVLASGDKLLPLPAEMRNLTIELADVVEQRRYNWGASEWKAAVTEHKVNGKKIGDGSECCQVCQEKHPETKAWMKYEKYKTCSCLTFDDNFDPSKYEKTHGAYSIGSCIAYSSAAN